MGEFRSQTVEGVVKTRGRITGVNWVDVDGNPQVFDFAQPLEVLGGELIKIDIEIEDPPPVDPRVPLMDEKKLDKISTEIIDPVKADAERDELP